MTPRALTTTEESMQQMKRKTKMKMKQLMTMRQVLVEGRLNSRI